MELFNHSEDSSSRLSANKKRSFKRGWKIALAILCLAIFGFGFLVLGAHLNSTGQTTTVKMLLIRMNEGDFSFLRKNANGRLAKIEHLSLDVKFENWERIRYQRALTLSDGKYRDVSVPGKIRYNGETYRVNISLTGQMTDHLVHPYKWSLAIKVKDDEAIMGMKKFALIHPHLRGYLTDWIGNEMLKTQGVIGIRSDFVNLDINGQTNGLYYLEERYDKTLVEYNQFREGILFKLNQSEPQIYEQNKIDRSVELTAELIQLKKAIHLFLLDELPASQLFDLQKMASLHVVSDILNQKHGSGLSNVRFYYNPITKLVEPIGREWGHLSNETSSSQTSMIIEAPNPAVRYHHTIRDNPVVTKLIDSYAFEEAYIQQAYKLSHPRFLRQFMTEQKDAIDLLLNKLYQQNPFYKFPEDLIRQNQKYLHDRIHPVLPGLNATQFDLNQDSVFVHVENLYDLPIEIHHAICHSNLLAPSSERTFLPAKHKSKDGGSVIGFKLYDSFNVSNYSSDSLEIAYSILGMGEIRTTVVFEHEPTLDNRTQWTPTKRAPNVHEFDFLIVDETSQTIQFSEMKNTLSKDLIIPENFVVTAIPGCEIDLIQSARIISYAPFRFMGTVDSVITVTSSDATGQGLVVFNCAQTSIFTSVHFNRLSNISDVGWTLTGAITFYESPVNFDQCVFRENMKGDDFVNVIRTEMNMTQSSFDQIHADALDIDFGKGTMDNVEFTAIGNDAIDASGSQLFLQNIRIDSAGDKGISGGEQSHIIGRQVEITNSLIGIASKDNSIIEMDGLKLESNEIALSAYQKKSEFGLGRLLIRNATLINNTKEYLIEAGSTLSMDGKMINGQEQLVDEMLYDDE